MIGTAFFFDPDRREVCLTVTGHAGYAQTGEDPVCAAASILTCSLAQFALGALKGGCLRSAPGIRLKPGDALVRMRAKTEEDYEALLLAAKVVYGGFAVLAKNYPENVNLNGFGEEN